MNKLNSLFLAVVVFAFVGGCAPKEPAAYKPKRGGFLRVLNATGEPLAATYRGILIGPNGLAPGQLSEFQNVGAKNNPVEVRAGGQTQALTLDTSPGENLTLVVTLEGGKLNVLEIRGEPRETGQGKTQVVIVNATKTDQAISIDSKTESAAPGTMSKPIETSYGSIDVSLNLDGKSVTKKIETKDGIGHTIFIFKVDGKIKTIDASNKYDVPAPEVGGMAPA